MNKIEKVVHLLGGLANFSSLKSFSCNGAVSFVTDPRYNENIFRVPWALRYITAQMYCDYSGNLITEETFVETHPTNTLLTCLNTFTSLLLYFVPKKYLIIFLCKVHLTRP